MGSLLEDEKNFRIREDNGIQFYFPKTVLYKELLWHVKVLFQMLKFFFENKIALPAAIQCF